MKHFHVATSKISNKGIFAEQEYNKGDITFILKGKKVRLLIKSEKDSQKGSDWVGIAKNLWIDPVGYSKYLNHSCNPNMGIKGKVTFVALRKIKKDEELTIDYSITESDKFWKMKCKCGAKNCRKIIRSVQFLPKNTYKIYIPYVPRYFQKEYTCINGKISKNN